MGSICGSGRFSLGDTELNKEIPWIAANGLLFAARNICKNIGWKDLEMRNFIVGKKIKIDGLPFKCRIPVISDNCLEDDEWKQLQEAVNSSAESDLHWGTEKRCRRHGRPGPNWRLTCELSGIY